MEQLKLMVPTYVGGLSARGLDMGDDPDFSEPRIPVTILGADGVRIILGTHNGDDCQTPDVQIERRLNGWAVFLHPLGGSDASGYVLFLDDGRSYLVPETLGATDTIKVIASFEDLPELDLPSPDVEITEFRSADVPTPSQKFLFETFGAACFSVEASNKEEALLIAEEVCEYLASKQQKLGIPEYDVTFVVDGLPPELIEE